MPTIGQSHRRSFRRISREDLRGIPLPEAGERTRWVGIPHGELADAIVEESESIGLHVNNELWEISKQEQVLSGYIYYDLSPTQFETIQGNLDLEGVHTYQDFAPELVRLRCGVYHSNDSSIALHFIVAPEVLVSQNGLAVDEGSIVLYRRHTKKTGGENARPAIKVALKEFVKKSLTIRAEIEAFRRMSIDDSAAHDIICAAGAKKIVPWSQLGKVERLWREDANLEANNAWNLYNAFTMVSASQPISREMRSAKTIRKLILGVQEQEEEVLREAFTEDLSLTPPSGNFF